MLMLDASEDGAIYMIWLSELGRCRKQRGVVAVNVVGERDIIHLSSYFIVPACYTHKLPEIHSISKREVNKAVQESYKSTLFLLLK
jgi:hypothetical protein